MPDLSIVIVSWNVQPLLRACLGSIQGGTGALTAETIVVDSASSDGTPDMIRAEFPWVKLIEPGENTGFSRRKLA